MRRATTIGRKKGIGEKTKGARRQKEGPVDTNIEKESWEN